MSVDKRTVHTDALETLGTIIGENERRDAIHLAVEPVIAGENLKASDRIFLGDDGKAYKAHGNTKALGIVDPFITTKVRVGERFWLVVMPRMITSLRHVWTHPDFADTADITKEDKDTAQVQRSKAYIANLADSVGISYQRLIDGAEDWVHCQENGHWGNYIVGGAEMEGESVPDEFWHHYEVVTGNEVPEEYRSSFFSCSC